MSADPTDADETDVELRDMIEAQIEERRGRVLLMKLAGATFSKIAADQKISISTARKDYQLALRANMHASPEMRIARQQAVVTDILRANYPKMMDGDKDAAANILRALDREAKLFGLDAPTRVLAQVNDVEFANEAARLITRVAKIDPTALKELTRVGPSRQEPIDVEVEPDPAPEFVAPAPAGLRTDAATGEALGEDFPPEHPADPEGDPLADANSWPGPTYAAEDRIIRQRVEALHVRGLARRQSAAGRPDARPALPGVPGPGAGQLSAEHDQPADGEDDDLDGWSNI